MSTALLVTGEPVPALFGIRRKKELCFQSKQSQSGNLISWYVLVIIERLVKVPNAVESRCADDQPLDFECACAFPLDPTLPGGYFYGSREGLHSCR